ncbi:MAG: hypothetical protein L0Z70_02055 [Chloroflexi bacterium]|nr:hypothetical protein [Chloroflexota bacterium]
MNPVNQPETKPALQPGSLLKSVLPLLALIVFVVGGFAVYQFLSGRQAAAEEAKIAAEQEKAADAIADKWGFRVVRVAPLAEGGMLELRFQVVDPDKVIFMFDEVENIPVLIDEDSGVEVTLGDLPHSHNVPAGLYEYIIYTNVSGAVKPGDLVTLKVGDLQLQHIKVLE